MRVHTLRSNHPQIGSSVTRIVQIGQLHVSVEFCRGVYGYRHTPSYGVRVWFA
jgi:hypothetical protein